MNDEDFANQAGINNALRESIVKRSDTVHYLEEHLGYDEQVAAQGYDATQKFADEYPEYAMLVTGEDGRTSLVFHDQNISKFFVEQEQRLIGEGDTRDSYDRWEAIANEAASQLRGNAPKELKAKGRYVSPESRAIQEMAEARRATMEVEDE